LKNILLVEDELIISFSLKVMLTRRGFNVVDAVRTGEDAVKSYYEYKPDTILMDINLKGEMTGVEAAQEILKTDRPRIILISAYKKEEVIKEEEMLKLEYLKKPLDEEKLFLLLQSA
jgi:two-component SAPR family response regulator